MANQDYNYPPPSFGQQQDYGQSNYGNDYGGDRGNSGGFRGNSNYNKGGSYGGNSNRGGFKGGSDMGSSGGIQVQDDTVFVSGMALETSEYDIANHFGSIGIIKKDKRTNKPKIWIYRNKDTQESKGECTITFDDPCTASSAIKWFDGKEFNGNTIKVQLAQRNNSWQNKGGPKKFGGPPGAGGGRFERNNDDDRGSRGGGFGNRNSDRGGFGNRNNDRGPQERGGHREGDWICSDCQNKNFAWRNECNRCKAPKADDESGGSNSGGSRDNGNRNFGNRDSGPRNFNRGGMRGNSDRGDRQQSGGFNRQRPY